MFFAFSSPLFWYRLIFLTELFAAEALMTFKLKRRSYFALRAVLLAAGCYAVTFLFPIAAYNAFYVSFMFVFIFFMTIAALYACYREPLLNVVFCCIAAYATQHIAYEVYTFFVTAFGLQTASLPYAETGKLAFDVWTMAIYIESYAAGYALMYLFFGTRIKRGTDFRIGNVAQLVISGVILLTAVLLSSVVTYRDVALTDVVIMCVVHAYDALCCVLALVIQFSMLRRKKIQSDLDTLQRLHDSERKHYMLFKENVDYINLKCHDLKHQIRRIAQGGEVKDSVISEIENAVSIYDSDVKTGNETLDIILTEKRLACAGKGITFSVIADGRKLDFMADADICALFGNALDNAIEAVCRLPDRDKRSVSLSVRSSCGFVSVRVRNRCAGEVRFENGLPVTTKSDRSRHGYGMKSIKAITERYGGQLDVTTGGGEFSLGILFPAGGI